MTRSGDQYPLFDAPQQLPNGFTYTPNFLTPPEEAELVRAIEQLPLVNAPHGEYTARRRIMHFGWGYDYEKETLHAGAPLPAFLQPLVEKIAAQLHLLPEQIAEALITEYSPGTPLGWHRDNEKFDTIVGVSLSGWCRLRLRPITSKSLSLKEQDRRDPKEVTTVTLEPRSLYLMQGESRWDFQHSVASVETLRYSITLRTLTLEQLRLLTTNGSIR